MDNKEELMHALEEFGRNPTNNIPDILERYFQRVALTGETLFEWEKLKPAFRHKMDQSMKEFNEQVPTDHLHPSPNVEVVKFEEMRTRLLNVLDSFTGAPFTIQRLCELIIHPQKQYKRTDKFLRGIEKNLMIVSAVDPFGNKIVSEPKPFINGLDSNGVDAGELHTPEKKGSPFLPPPPANSPATIPWFNSITPTNSPVTASSQWHRLENETNSSNVSSSPTFNLQSSSFGENWPETELDDYAHSPPEKKSRLSASNSDSLPSSSNVEPSQSAGSYYTGSPEASKSSVGNSESSVSSAVTIVSSRDQPSKDNADAVVASSTSPTSAAGSSHTAVTSSSGTAVTSSECLQASDSITVTSHFMDSASTVECHAASTSPDHAHGMDTEQTLITGVTSVQSLTTSEQSSLPSDNECSPILHMEDMQESSEAAPTDSDSVSSGSDSNSSADSNVMRSELTDQQEHSSRLVQTNVAESTSEDTGIKRDSEDSKGFDLTTDLEEDAPSSDLLSSPCPDHTLHGTGYNSEVSSSSESRPTADENLMPTSNQSPVHSTGTTTEEMHSSGNVTSDSQHSTNEAADADTMSVCYQVSDTTSVISESASADVSKESTLDDCEQNVSESTTQAADDISEEPSEHTTTTNTTLSSTSQGDSDHSTDSPEHEPMDTN